MQGSVLHAASEKKVVVPTKQFGLGYCHAPLLHTSHPTSLFPSSPLLWPGLWLSQGPHPPSRKITSILGPYMVDLHFDCSWLGRMPPSFGTND